MLDALRQFWRTQPHPRTVVMLTLFNQNPKANRRKLIQAAGTGLLGVSLPKILAAEESNFSDAPRPTAKNVIFMHLFGGPSQLETFDMKPDAPSDIRGPLNQRHVKQMAC